MIRKGCMLIALVAILIVMFHSPASAREEDRDWNDKLKQLEQIWV